MNQMQRTTMSQRNVKFSKGTSLGGEKKKKNLLGLEKCSSLKTSLNKSKSNADLYLLLRGERLFKDEAPKTQRFLDIESSNIINRIQETITDLDRKLIRIFITYARGLPQEGKQIIDDSIFKAQMEKYFNLTDEQMLDRIKSVLCPVAGIPKIYIEDYVRLMCIFVTDLIHVKVDFVFAVYNARADEYLTTADLRFFMRPMIRFASSSLSDRESLLRFDMNQHELDEEALDEVVDLFINLVDRNGDKCVDKDEFFHLVEKDRLMMCCLGQCLPEEHLMKKFYAMFKNDYTKDYKNPFEVQALFRSERRRCLKGPKPKYEGLFKELYPVDLEMHV